MEKLPNLAGVATQELVEKIGGGNFQASYINWSRTLHMLREHAAGWLPELVRTAEGGILHRAPTGAYLLIRFRHLDGTVTPEVPQAIMDTRNAAIPLERITARDITDTHRRGVCMAAAFTFGLAYELWAKMPLETGFAEPANEPTRPTVMLAEKTKPTGDAWERLSGEERTFLQGVADKVGEYLAGADGSDLALTYLHDQQLDSDETIALWTRLDSKQRAALKKAKAAQQAKDNQQQEQAA